MVAEGIISPVATIEIQQDPAKVTEGGAENLGVVEEPTDVAKLTVPAPSSPSSSSPSSTLSSPMQAPITSMEPKERIICMLNHHIKHFEVGTRPNDERRRRRGNCKECVVSLGSSKSSETSYYCEECSEAAAHIVFLHPEHHLNYHLRNFSEDDKQLYTQITGKTI